MAGPHVSRAASTNSSVSLETHSSDGSTLTISQQASSTDLDADKDPLPEGWDAKQLPDGCILYVDHINRRTQWNHPRRVQMETDRRRVMAPTLAKRNPGMSDSEVWMQVFLNK